MATYPTSGDDICVWPDGTWCYRCDLHEYTYMSDDFEVLFVDTSAHTQFLEAQEFGIEQPEA